jgi:hypothetical protein
MRNVLGAVHQTDSNLAEPAGRQSPLARPMPVGRQDPLAAHVIGPASQDRAVVSAVDRLLRMARDRACALELRDDFHRLAQHWRAETSHLSVTWQAAMHPAYQQIIGMGPAALPLILAELRTRPGAWSWALECIARENPAENATTREEALAAWEGWARDKGLL